MSVLYCFRRASFLEFLSDFERVLSVESPSRSETYFVMIGFTLASCALVRLTCFLRSASRSSADSGACFPLVWATLGAGVGVAFAWVIDG